MPEPDRDIEPMLKHMLRTSSSVAVSACPDAETLAAWNERTLPAVEMAAFERHAADCARCRAMLAAFVRADPSAPAAETGATGLDAVPFWRRWRLNWLVPLAATATALAVYVATPSPSDDRRVTEELLADRTSGVTRSNEVAVPLEKERESVERDADTAGKAAPAALAEEAARNVETRADARDRRVQAEADTAPDQKAQAVQKAETAVSAARTAPAAPRDPSPSFAPEPAAPAMPMPAAPRAASAPPPSVGAAAAEAVSPSAPQDGAASLVDARSANRAPDALRRERSAQSNEQAVSGGRRDAARSLPLSGSPNGLRFRVSGERLERGASGDTWSTVTLPGGVSGSDITSGTVAGRTIWMVGRGGLVLRSPEDGAFVRVPSPSSADLRAVTAEDERTATVVASDGRRYSTTDGGARWTAR